MTAWYNENDPFAAAWLRELIAEGLIAPGDVDERSIEDVKPDDLRPYAQCHFFAGIGIWSLALRRAGWPDDRPVWTGSCPCQPFSAAGKGGGFADERHLWPAFHWLIGECRPGLVLGEQVASKDGLAWLDLVQADLERSDYAFGAVDLCAAGFGAPHIRQRSFWVADATSKLGDRTGRAGSGGGFEHPVGSEISRLAFADGGHTGAEGIQRSREQRLVAPDGSTGRLADIAFDRWREECPNGGRLGARDGAQRFSAGLGTSGDDLRPGPLNGLWRAADWLGCADGKWRPVESGTFPLVATGTFRNRVGLLRGAGNSINLAVAQGFIESVMDYLKAKELFDG